MLSRDQRRPSRLLLALGATLIASLVPVAPANAAIPSRTPDLFEAASSTVAGGDLTEFHCQGRAESTHDTLFIGMSVGPSDVPAVQTLMVGFKFNQDVYASVSAGSVPVTVTVLEGAPLFEVGVKFYWRFSDQPPPPGSILRAGWASWGANAGCRFVHNGREIQGTSQPVGRATYALPTDFSGGVAATASAGTSLGSAGALQSYTRASSGYLHALVAVDRGRTRAEGPEGQVYEETGAEAPWTAVAEPTSGRWRYAFDGVSRDHGAVLWLLELPSSP